MLGYVNELDKAWLYLNANLFISPSSTEGFGIPALDACCLGIKTFLSDIPSHQEIYRKFENNEQIKLIQTNNSEAWIENMNLILDKAKLDTNEKDYRLKFHEKNIKSLTEIFKENLTHEILR